MRAVERQRRGCGEWTGAGVTAAVCRLVEDCPTISHTDKIGKLTSRHSANLISFHSGAVRSVPVSHINRKEKTMGKGDNSKKDDKKSKKPKQDKKVVKPDAKK